jgi:tetratricopeptide (TPR) repeat protein
MQLLGLLGADRLESTEPAANLLAGGALGRLLTVEGKVEYWPVGSTNWQTAVAGQLLHEGDRLRTGRRSRSTIRMSDLVARVNELTTLQVLAPPGTRRGPLLDLKSGSAYFFSRERTPELQLRTPLVAAAIRGTELHVQVRDDGITTVAVLEGEVELASALGSLTLHSGEQGRVAPGEPPSKTAVIDAINIIQWCLYYPAVVHLEDLALTEAEAKRLEASLSAYARGDLLQAAAKCPLDAPPTSEAERVYFAAVCLAVGRVDEAQRLLTGASATNALAEALEEMIAATHHRLYARKTSPRSATDWLAESYYLQSRAQLPLALSAARAAVDASPGFAVGWGRVAELEFCFGHRAAALDALKRATPPGTRNPQARALRGFLLAGQGKLSEALAWFDSAIEADGALGNAWLGRGLCRIRRGEVAAGCQDLEVAAALEPQRALLRSYLGKALSLAGRDERASRELALAQKLDERDPTAWLYSALLNQQRNLVNQAIADLERSSELNANRRLFRSRLLLDQDRAVRSANLALVYKEAGMSEVSLREAARAVDYDYANYSTHLFLASTYEALRDPKGYNLRYETPRMAELLLANLLAPVAGGVLSRSISQQDYGQLFERNRLGVSSWTEYSSRGDWFELAAQYGICDNFSYSVEGHYSAQQGYRPNNEVQDRYLSAQTKHQVSPQDSLYLQAIYSRKEGGDIVQYYDPSHASRGLRFRENQEPLLFVGWHREWSPGSHTLFLGSRLDDTQLLREPAGVVPFFYQTNGVLRRLIGQGVGISQENRLTAYSAELQQVYQGKAGSLIGGARYQAGWVDTDCRLTRSGTWPVTSQTLTTDFERFNLYAYSQWQVTEAVRLTAGLGYDWLLYPVNLTTWPVSSGTQRQDLLSPKAGLLVTPWSGSSLRAMYCRSLSGFSLENSVRLEPTQVAGFNQAFRSLAPESGAGLTSGGQFDVWSVGWEQAAKSRTYLGIEGQLLRSLGDRVTGALTNSTPIRIPDRAADATEAVDYEEKVLLVTANQLLGQEWSVGARYRLNEAALNVRFARVPVRLSAPLGLDREEQATFHQVTAFAIFNHRSGFFAEFQSSWNAQSNRGYSPDRPGDEFWLHDCYAGFRFSKRRAELRLGVLNLADQDYQLNPLTLYAEFPRERTFVVSFKFRF